MEREVEDIDALITAAGGSAFAFGISSGAAIALEAAIKLGDKVKRLAMYEAPTMTMRLLVKHGKPTESSLQRREAQKTCNQRESCPRPAPVC